MKNYRLFLLGFITTSLIFLTGLEKSGVDNAYSTKKKTISIKESQFNHKDGHVNSKKNKPSVLRVEAGAELQKSLNLSIPFNDSENSWLKAEQNRVVPGELSNLFVTEKKPRSLDLDGQMLMSQEPEMDKRKSLDGAGIVINLKR